MRRLPPEPQVGDRITAELVRELIRCIRERQLLKGPNYSISTGPNGTYLKFDLPKIQISPRAPLPFEIRWAQSENNNQGAWVIWLPDIAQLVMLKDAYITPTGVTAAQVLPGGWYTIDDVDENSTSAYLVVTIPDTGSASALFSSTEGQATTGETVLNIAIAEMATDTDTGARRVKQYVDSAIMAGNAKDGSPGADGADAGLSITQEPVAPSTDHPGGGVEITLQPLQGGQAHGQPTVVTLWNGSGGGGGGTDLSDTPALDVVPSTGNASAGVAATASRSDHVHKMPETVVLTDVDQTINSIKTIGMPEGGNYARLDFQHTANGERVRIQHGTYNGQEVFSIFLNLLGGNVGNIITTQGTFLELGARATGAGAINDVRLGVGADAALAGTAPSSSSRKIVDIKWVTAYFQQKLTAGSNIIISGNTISAIQPPVRNGKLTITQGTMTLGTFTANQQENVTIDIPTPPSPPSGTIEFVADVDWDASTHKLRKRMRILNLATGAVTDKAGTAYADGWDVAANTTPISSIIG